MYGATMSDLPAGMVYPMVDNMPRLMIVTPGDSNDVLLVMTANLLA